MTRSLHSPETSGTSHPVTRGNITDKRRNKDSKGVRKSSSYTLYKFWRSQQFYMWFWEKPKLQLRVREDTITLQSEPIESSDVKLRLSLPMQWKYVGWIEVYATTLFYSFLSSTLDDEGSTSRPGHFIAGKEPRYSLNRRLSGPQSRSGRFEKQKSFFALAGIWIPDRQARHLVAIALPTRLSRIPNFFICLSFSILLHASSSHMSAFNCPDKIRRNVFKYRREEIVWKDNTEVKLYIRVTFCGLTHLVRDRG